VRRERWKDHHVPWNVTRIALYFQTTGKIISIPFQLTFSLDEENVTEAYFYDFNSFIGEVGGSLGLFLGLSLLAAFDAIAISLSYCTKRLKRRNKNEFLKDEQTVRNM